MSTVMLANDDRRGRRAAVLDVLPKPALCILYRKRVEERGDHVEPVFVARWPKEAIIRAIVELEFPA